MNPFEAPLEREPGENWKLLKQLEAEGNYIFHGSPTGGIEEFEPRQPTDWSSGKAVEHGRKSIVGTPKADISIFRALVNKDWTRWSSNGELFEASKIALGEAEKGKGFVYVFDKNDFQPFEGEWRAYKPIRPIRAIEVDAKDLPSWIQVISGDLM